MFLECARAEGSDAEDCLLLHLMELRVKPKDMLEYLPDRTLSSISQRARKWKKIDKGVIEEKLRMWRADSSGVSMKSATLITTKA
ncbi:hypothetical protein D3C85_942200 [compost metagenome]